jgi:hypothetical protein
MKALSRISHMKSTLSVFPALFAAAFALMVGCDAYAQQAKTEGSIATTTRTEQGVVTNRPTSGALSPGVNEIVQMADAGVSTEVLKAYVEYSSTPYQPTDQDIITLKKHNVADEVVTLMLKRGAQVRAAVVQARNEALVKALSARRMSAGGLDPESHDYFQYYYLQPRALASVYERLSPYYSPSFPYSYSRWP